MQLPRCPLGLISGVTTRRTEATMYLGKVTVGPATMEATPTSSRLKVKLSRNPAITAGGSSAGNLAEGAPGRGVEVDEAREAAIHAEQMGADQHDDERRRRREAR
jgi:hypothetical protein